MELYFSCGKDLEQERSRVPIWKNKVRQGGKILFTFLFPLTFNL